MLNVLCRANIDIFEIRDTATVKGILGYTKEASTPVKEVEVLETTG